MWNLSEMYSPLHKILCFKGIQKPVGKKGPKTSYDINLKTHSVKILLKYAFGLYRAGLHVFAQYPDHIYRPSDID